MKKIINVLLCMGCVLACTACDAQTTETQENSTIADAITADATEETTTKWATDDSLIEGEKELTQAPDGWSIVNLDSVEEYSVTANQETDGNPELSTYSYCQSENGYYCLENVGDRYVIYFFDNTTHGYVPLCNRPECTHADNDCIASFDNAWGLEYYNGKLYTVVMESENSGEEVDEKGRVCSSETLKVNLYEISLDGTSKKAIQCIKTIEKSKDAYNLSRELYFCIHQGYVYYVHYIGHPLESDDIYKNGKNCLFRVAIGGKETDSECIYAFSKSQVGIPISPIKAYGKYLYFCDRTGNSWNGQLYRINTEENSVECLPVTEEILDGVNFWIKEDGIYYIGAENPEEIHKYLFKDNSQSVAVNLRTLERTADIDLCAVLYDGTYWFDSQVLNENGEAIIKTSIFNEQFEKLGEIDSSTSYSAGFNIKNIVPVLEGKKAYGWIDKSEFAKGIFIIHEVESSE